MYIFECSLGKGCISDQHSKMGEHKNLNQTQLDNNANEKNIFK